MRERSGFRATMLAMRKLGTLRSTIRWRRVTTSSIASSLDEVSFVILSFLLLSWCFLQRLNSVTYVYRQVCFEVPVHYSHCVYLYAICQLKNKNIMLSYLDIWLSLSSLCAFVLLNAPSTLSCDTSDFFWSNHDLGLSFVLHYTPVPTWMAGVWVHSSFKWPCG